MASIGTPLVRALVTLMTVVFLGSSIHVGLSSADQISSGPLATNGGQRASASDGRSVYMFGGAVQARPSELGQADTRIVRFDLESGTSVVMSGQLPIGLRCSFAFYDGISFWVIGGLTGQGVGSSAIIRYDPTLDKALIVGNLPDAVGCGSGVWTGSVAYLFGGMYRWGWLGHAPSSSVLRFDPRTLETTNAGSIPPLLLTSAMWTGRYAYIFGGGELVCTIGCLTFGTNGITRYDPITQSSTKISATLPEKDYGTAAIWDGQAGYVLGSSISVFDPSTEALSQKAAKLPHWAARHSSAVLDQDRILLLGGISEDFDQVQGVAYYTPSADSLILDDYRLPTTSWTTTGVWADNVAYIFVGTSIYRFDPATKRLTLMPTKLPCAFNSPGPGWNPDAKLVYLFSSCGSDGYIVTYNPETGVLARTKTIYPAYRLSHPMGSGVVPIWAGSTFWLYAGLSVRLYHPAADVMEALPDVPGQIGAVRAGVYADKNMYLFGLSTWRFDTRTWLWERKRSTPGGYVPGAAWWDGQHIFLLGGWEWIDRCGWTSASRITRYNPLKDEMHPMPTSLPFPLAESAVVSDSNHYYVFGGRDIGWPCIEEYESQVTDLFFKYSPSPGPPGNVTAAPGPGLGKVFLRWDAPDRGSFGHDITHYEIFRSQSGVEQLIGTLPTESLLTFMDEGCLRLCSYRIRAVNSSGPGTFSAGVIGSPLVLPGSSSSSSMLKNDQIPR